jgi:hypothetical protein
VYLGGHQKYSDKKDGSMYLTQNNFIFAHTERREERNWQITIPFHTIIAHELVSGDLIIPYFDESGNKQVPRFRVSSKVTRSKHLDWIDSLFEHLKAIGFIPENLQQETPNTPSSALETANIQEPEEAKIGDIQQKRLGNTASMSTEKNYVQASNESLDDGKNYKELYEQLKNSIVVPDESKLITEGNQDPQRADPQTRIQEMAHIKNLETENACLKEQLEQERRRIETIKQKKRKEPISKEGAELLLVIQMRLAKGEITIEEYDALKERFE